MEVMYGEENIRTNSGRKYDTKKQDHVSAADNGV